MVSEILKDMDELQRIERELTEIRRPNSDYIRRKIAEVFPNREKNAEAIREAVAEMLKDF